MDPGLHDRLPDFPKLLAVFRNWNASQCSKPYHKVEHRRLFHLTKSTFEIDNLFIFLKEICVRENVRVGASEINRTVRFVPYF